MSPSYFPTLTYLAFYRNKPATYVMVLQLKPVLLTGNHVTVCMTHRSQSQTNRQNGPSKKQGYNERFSVHGRCF
jgi:hypothetical protein